MRIKIRPIILIASLLGLPAISQAWDGVNTGFVSAIQVTDGANFGFRIFLNNVSAYCTGASSGFAYLNAVDSNYQVYVATLLLAKSIGSTVTLYASNDSTGNCHLGYINMN